MPAAGRDLATWLGRQLGRLPRSDEFSTGRTRASEVSLHDDIATVTSPTRPTRLTRLVELPTPALVLDLDVLESNLDRMAGRLRDRGVALRPHVKTHKCVRVGELQRQRGARGITVATLEEAAEFAAAGFDDITWAFPLIPGRLDEVAELAGRVRLGVLVDSLVAVEALESHTGLVRLASDGRPLRAWMKVDCGYHRAGVDPGSRLALELAERLAGSRHLELAGILTHAGHAYDCRGRPEIEAVASEECLVMKGFAARLREAGIDVEEVSVGSTPTMSVDVDLEGITEARPGNYAFFDYTQTVIGSCAVADCALTVLASVVSCQPGAKHSVVDAGALALSKDAAPSDDPAASGPTYGWLFRSLEAAELDRSAPLRSLSQEHGEVGRALPVGTTVRILPVHSCLTAACHDVYFVVRGDEVVDRWPVLRRR